MIAIEDAVIKTNSEGTASYYQISKGKTGFYIDVPANVTKVIVKAKCGSSGKSGTSKMLSVNGQTFAVDLGADYAEYEATVSVSKDSTIEIKNADSSCSMNVKEIKVIASSGWSTKLTSGADLTNIDAYEVDNRNDQVPANVTAKSGGAQYSNFDVSMGDSGMGITIAPTEPDQAKADVLKYSGRHESDFAHNFDNATDDASYAKNDELNNALVAYKTGMTAIQGNASSSSSSSSSSDNTGNTGDNTSGNTGDNGGSVTPAAGVAASLTFTDSSALTATSAGTTFTLAKGTGAAGSKDYYASTGKIKILKMEGATTISFTSPGTTSDKYTMTINYVAASAGALTLTPTGGTASEITLAAGGSVSDKNTNNASTTSVATEITGGTAYVISRKSTETYIHSIVITAK